MRYHHTSMQIAEKKNKQKAKTVTRPNSCKDLGKQDQSYIVGGNKKW